MAPLSALSLRDIVNWQIVSGTTRRAGKHDSHKGHDASKLILDVGTTEGKPEHHRFASVAVDEIADLLTKQQTWSQHQQHAQQRNSHSNTNNFNLVLHTSSSSHQRTSLNGLLAEVTSPSPSNKGKIKKLSRF
jgi:hypothetical protein